MSVFTEDQAASLNGFQQWGGFHPYTCGNGCEPSLVATVDGWTCPGGCGYKQDWAFDWSMDWSWRASVEARQEALGMEEGE